jgi:hypothetical protein
VKIKMVGRKLREKLYGGKLGKEVYYGIIKMYYQKENYYILCVRKYEGYREKPLDVFMKSYRTKENIILEEVPIPKEYEDGYIFNWIQEEDLFPEELTSEENFWHKVTMGGII